MAFANIKNKLEYDRLEMQRFVERHGLYEFKMNPHFPVNTLLIMRGAVAAALDGRLPAYEEAVMRHMWAEPKKMDDPAVVQAALDASGLDGARLARPHPGRRRQADAPRQHRARGRARGLFGLPAFFVGGRDVLREGSAARRRGGDRAGGERVMRGPSGRRA